MGVECVLVRFVGFVAMAAAAAVAVVVVAAVVVAVVVVAVVDISTESRALVVAHTCLTFPDPEYEFVEIAILELAAVRAFVFEAVVSAVWAVG